jgi:ubiquinol-cytochrome c reductase cytochrome b subunit
MRHARQLIDWFEARLELRKTLLPLLRHPVPPNLGWWYVFGSATMTLFLLQAFTGVCLALVYVPSADQAYESLTYLNQQFPLGWLLRSLHYWGSSAMVILLGLHMARVFLMGAYKYPRELTWLVGVGLLVFTLAMAFSGQVLRWDADAYWGVGVGAAITGRVPAFGEALVRMLLGGPTIGAATLSRFFAVHVFLIPGALIAFLVVHLYLVLKLGISARPVPGQPVNPDTYAERYEKQLQAGEPFFPGAMLRDGVFAALTLVIVVGLAVMLGPKGPGAPPDPTIIPAEPRPDWPFLPLFALMALSPPALESFLMLGLPPLLLLILIVGPLLTRYGERSPRRRPVAVLGVILLVTCLGVLGWEGVRAPWSPDMHAWSGTPIPPSIVTGLTPLQLQGAVVFQNKTCRNCHALDGQGGQRGPDLTNVATALTHDELVRQVIQGGGLMPAYGEQLSPAEVDALVAFLQTLHPTDESPSTPTVAEEPAERSPADASSTPARSSAESGP